MVRFVVKEIKYVSCDGTAICHGMAPLNNSQTHISSWSQLSFCWDVLRVSHPELLLQYF